MTVEQVIQPGLIRFESDGCQSGYLTAPYIWVWLFLKSRNSNLDPLIRDWPFWDYADIHKLWNGDPSPGTQIWQNFESHCARIRAIKSKILGDGLTTNLSSVHFSTHLNRPRKIQNLPLDVHLGKRQPEPTHQNGKLNAVMERLWMLGHARTASWTLRVLRLGIFSWAYKLQMARQQEQRSGSASFALRAKKSLTPCFNKNTKSRCPQRTFSCSSQLQGLTISSSLRTPG